MKFKNIILIPILVFIVGCAELDLNPLAEGSSENWYSTETEVEMSLNDLFRMVFWPQLSDEWTDDYTRREALTPITSGTVDGQWGTVNTTWQNTYKAIVRANLVLQNMDRIRATTPEAIVDRLEGNAYFARASFYSRLVSLFGDVVYFEGVLDLNEAFTLSRTPKNTIIQAVYDDFDSAAERLPLSYGNSQNKMATKGAALGMKARFALYMGDYAIARDAAKACMDLDVYQLHPSYSALFLTQTKNPNEEIFGIPRSRTLNVTRDVRDFLPRLAGGWGAAQAPSWDLFNAYTCSDGLPIDESPLYNPREPFQNRDPRCTKTIVEFQTRHFNHIYQPHPDSISVLNFNTGAKVSNNDTRSVAPFASFNGLMLKKGVDSDWLINFHAEDDVMILRFADVLLMYAEAKMELGEIDQSVHDALNKVRARAYGVDISETNAYPAITETNQAALRKIIRMERRMELAFENHRYMDIIRWRIAEKVLNKPVYGMLDVADLRTKVVQPGLWFFPDTPSIDQDGIADMSPMYDAGLIRILAIRNFDATRQYLWPIPTKEILINSNLEQNPGY
ncbi:MAG: RagB/SusD family nutrient uptake outer membrane protein [Cyclobacteriaceae bacterium]